MNTLLVVGARPGSIGSAVAQLAREMGSSVVTMGLTEEDMQADLLLTSMGELKKDLILVEPMHVVCTAGMNMVWPASGTAPEDPSDWFRWHYEANVMGPMRLLTAWQSVLRAEGRKGPLHHFTALSSNSARIPRSNSAAYCASKAALSMALRVKAREASGSNLVVYGYEPGLVAATPMTAHIEDQLPGVPLTRMRDPRLARGLPVDTLAWFILQNLNLGLVANGVMFPLDADEG